MSQNGLQHRAVTEFRGRALPERAWPIGYARLIDRYDLKAPLPTRLLAVSEKYRKSETERWLLLGSRSEIPDDLGAHLTMALKWEGVDLAVLAALFRVVDPSELADFVSAQPTSAYGRRVWFFYEWLTGEELPVPDLAKATAVEAVDPSLQFARSGGELSSRHRVIDNLPGTPRFCPLVRRSEELARFDPEALRSEAASVVGRTHPDVLHRAGAFLMLADSRASFEIEGERPSSDRLHRWGYAIQEAGRTELSVNELLRLQRLVIGDDRFVQLGLRTQGGFVGVHDRRSGAPIPDHISARPDDLPHLMEGLVQYVKRALEGKLDGVAAAASASFGLVYIHPFEDGNGRLHRWLLHHVLSVAGLSPSEVVFPISHVILKRIKEYRLVLESHSLPILPFIEWEETPDHNVRVTNDTADYYRFFDATPHTEFLYSCIEETIKKDLPDEIRYLEAFDRFATGVQAVIDMPARRVDLLVRFLEQNGGTLSQRARTNEFAALRPEEIAQIEGLFSETLGNSAESRVDNAC